MGNYVPAVVVFVIGAVIAVVVELSTVGYNRKKGDADAKFSLDAFARNLVYAYAIGALLQISASVDKLHRAYGEHIRKDPMVRAEESLAELGDHSLFPGVVQARMERTRALLAEVSQLRMTLESDGETSAAWEVMCGKASSIVEVRNLSVRGSASAPLSAWETDVLTRAAKRGARVAVLYLMGSGAGPPSNPFGGVSVSVRAIDADKVMAGDGFMGCKSVLADLDYSVFDESVAMIRSVSSKGTTGSVITAEREAHVTPASRCFAGWFQTGQEIAAGTAAGGVP